MGSTGKKNVETFSQKIFRQPDGADLDLKWCRANARAKTNMRNRSRYFTSIQKEDVMNNVTTDLFDLAIELNTPKWKHLCAFVMDAAKIEFDKAFDTVKPYLFGPLCSNLDLSLDPPFLLDPIRDIFA